MTIGRVVVSCALLAALPVLLSAGTAPPAPVRFAWFRYEGHDATVVHPDAGQYRNPVLPGFYPDPSVIRVGNDFYLVNSTFAYFPGLPVFHSRDLVHWTQIANAIDRPTQLDFTGRGLSEGLFAPTLHYADGRFYIINTCIGCGGNFIITARDPAGPWSNPIWVHDVGGIDPSLFTDEDGTTWLVNDDAPPDPPQYEGHRAIWIRRFDLGTMKTVGSAKAIVNGGVDIAAKPVWVEGPHLLRHDGRYYLMTAEGGTAAGHSEAIYRSDRPDGPFVALRRPILTQRDLSPARPDPITSAGHAEMVDTPKGDWWAMFLAVRPYAGDFYNTGRETFLLPVAWHDGWPSITPPGAAIPYVASRPDLPAGHVRGIPLSGNFMAEDRFDAQTLGREWLMVRTPKTVWWHSGPGGLSLAPRADRIGDRGQPSYLGRRQQHLNASAATSLTVPDLRPGEKAGLVAYQNEAHYYFVGLVGDVGRRVVRVERRAGAGDPADGVVLATRVVPVDAGKTKPLQLRIVAKGGRYAFDYAVGRQRWMRLLDNADGTILSTAKAGGFVGTTIGPYAYAR